MDQGKEPYAGGKGKGVSLMRRLFTEVELDFIRNNYQSMTDKEIGIYFGIRTKTIEQKRKSLGLPKMTSSERYNIKITPTIKSQLLNMFQSGIPYQKMADTLGWSYWNVSKFFEKESIKRRGLTDSLKKNLIEWCDKPDIPIYTFSRNNRTTPKTIRRYIKKLGLIVKVKSKTVKIKVNKQHTFNSMKEDIETYNFKCLSTEFKSIKDNIIIECPKGHVFKRRYQNWRVRDKTCPKCNRVPFIRQKKEPMCRKIFETLFNKLFPKTRRLFNYNVELDGYNDELKLGFEFNGIQHYQKNTWFTNNYEHGKTLLYDRYKKEMCQAMGITLIVIPYSRARTYKEAKNWIISQLKKKSIPKDLGNSLLPPRRRLIHWSETQETV